MNHCNLLLAPAYKKIDGLSNECQFSALATQFYGGISAYNYLTICKHFGLFSLSQIPYNKGCEIRGKEKNNVLY
ncbi:hypothetical protein HMPREF9176_0647 [Streptococcus downei F0415]|nr:hypothetical protein HMPREF9176_0647 [Streptococcus downei F0415]